MRAVIHVGKGLTVKSRRWRLGIREPRWRGIGRPWRERDDRWGAREAGSTSTARRDSNAGPSAPEAAPASDNQRRPLSFQALTRVARRPAPASDGPVVTTVVTTAVGSLVVPPGTSSTDPERRPQGFKTRQVDRKRRPDEHRRPVGLTPMPAYVRRNACEMLVRDSRRGRRRLQALHGQGRRGRCLGAGMRTLGPLALPPRPTHVTDRSHHGCTLRVGHAM